MSLPATEEYTGGWKDIFDLRLSQAQRLAIASGFALGSPEANALIDKKISNARAEIESLNFYKDQRLKKAAFQLGLNGENELNMAASGKYSMENANDLSNKIKKARALGSQQASSIHDTQAIQKRQDEITIALEDEIKKTREATKKTKVIANAKAAANARASENAAIKAAAGRILSPRIRTSSELTIGLNASPRSSFASTASTASTRKKQVWNNKPTPVSIGGKHKKLKKHNNRTKRLKRRS